MEYIYKFEKERQVLEFKFVGNLEKDINEIKLDNLVKKSFNKLKRYNNIEEIIQYIRTLYRDYEEKELIIDLYQDNRTIHIEYKDMNLLLFKLKEKSNELDFEYFNDNIKLNYKNNYKKNMVDEIIKNIPYINNIYKLNELKTYEFDYIDKLIYEVYKIFFNENPDFSNENINTRILNLLYILDNYGMSITEEFIFYGYGSKYPTSPRLEYELEKLVPFGEIKSINKPIPLQKEAINNIMYISNLLNEYTKDNETIDDILKKLSITIYNLHISNKDDITEDYINIKEKIYNKIYG